MNASVLHRLLLLSILVGLGFSAFATFEVVDTSLTSACSVNPFLSCGAVAASGDTGFPPPRGPIPDYAVGLLGFVALLALDVPLLRTYAKRWLMAILVLSAIGLGVAAVLAYVELAVIQHLCPVCLGAYLSDAAAFALAIAIHRARSRTDDAAADPASSAESEQAEVGGQGKESHDSKAGVGT